MDSGIRFVRSFDGTRLAYRTFGSGPPLLWLMDAFGSHTQLFFEQQGVRPFFERLGPGRQLVFVDCRGTGMSDRRCDDYSPDAITRDVEVVLEELEIGSCDVFASGGRHAIALRLAVGQPGLVNRIVFNSPFGLPPDESLANLMETNWNLFRELAIQRSTHRPLHEVRHVLDFTARCVDQREFLAFRRASGPAIAWELAAQVDQEVLTLDVDGCGLSDPDTNRAFAARFSNGRFVALPEGTMMPPWSEPGPMIQAIEEFLGPPLALGPTGEPESLTPRERQVLRLLVEGRTLREVAGELVISPATVSNHVVNVYSKLGVHRRAEAVNWAVRHGVT